ncbi:MAG: hypothetical protein ACI4SF_05250, partial [Oscillospiraceae bacterium]
VLRNRLFTVVVRFCSRLLYKNKGVITMSGNKATQIILKQLVMLTTIMSQNEEISCNLSELLNAYTRYTADFNMTTDEIVSLMAMLPTTVSNK